MMQLSVVVETEDADETDDEIIVDETKATMRARAVVVIVSILLSSFAAKVFGKHIGEFTVGDGDRIDTGQSGLHGR
jgi:hypothetical protein